VFEWIGWIATAVFAISYFCKQPATLRRIQAVAALMWIGYGLIIGAAPVVAANSVVAVLAVYSSTRRQRPEVANDGPESE
jgi:hypothetical protein